MTGCKATLVLAVAVALSGCAETPPVAAPAQVGPVAASAAPDTAVARPSPGSNIDVALSNDPSAPLNTPLCAGAEREGAAISQMLLNRQYANAGACTGFACYDAATATYIGADGYRHVCR